MQNGRSEELLVENCGTRQVKWSLCCTVPEEYGGPGGDFLHSVVVNEELAKVGATGPAFPLHSDIIVPYILAYGSEDQKRSWLPKVVSGETIMAIGMTEPIAGSDLQGIQTKAERDGNHFVLNGQKFGFLMAK